MAEREVRAMAEGRRQMHPPEGTDVPFEDAELIGGPRRRAARQRGGPVNGGPVLEHVQRFSDALCSATGACTISTYDGHHPDQSCALDILVSSAYGVMPGDFSLGDDVAAFTLNEWSSYGVSYVIWKQRIHSNDGRGWREMEDRGSITQNHFDHCHVSFSDRDNGGTILKLGISGEGVRRLQARLIELGWSLDVDGEFGQLTEAAVIEFQARNGLAQDGVVGPLTWTALGFG